jgi:hypothetical protein
VTGIVATSLAAGVIAILMIVGIRTKLPPPDPDWREHLPPPAPPASRLELMLLGVGYGAYVAGMISAGLRAKRLAVAFVAVFAGSTLMRLVIRIRAGIRVRRERLRVQ